MRLGRLSLAPVRLGAWGAWGVCPVLSARPRLPSVVLLLALHLCVFTMLGMLLFTGEKVRRSALTRPGALGFGWTGSAHPGSGVSPRGRSSVHP